MSNSRLRVQRRKPSHEEPAHLTATTQDRQMGPPPVSPIAANAAPLQVTAQRASPSLSSLGHDFSRVSILPPGTDAPSEPLSAPVQRGDHVRIQAAELQWHGLDLPIQRHDNLGQRIRAAQGGGESLGPAVQRSLEARLGADLSSVRVHTGGEADALCRSVDAMAFTTGSDIFFRHGTYNPRASQGFHMLAHEAAHTVQQARGPVAGTPGPGGVSISSPGDAFEREADISASRMMAGEPTHVQRRHSLRSTVGVPVYRLAVTTTLDSRGAGVPSSRH